MEGPLPKVIVFDLDYTLWPFWCDTHVTLPLKPTVDHTSAIDSYGDNFRFYRDVPEILQTLASRDDLQICLASRTHAPRVAQSLLSMIWIDGKPASTIFAFTAWGTSTKLQHFKELQLHTGVTFDQMLFFDDESRNRDVERLGVTFVHVSNGVNWKVLQKGIEKWRSNTL